jgi:hypothetical protein
VSTGFDYPAAEARPGLRPRRVRLAAAALATVALAALAGAWIGTLVGSRGGTARAATRHVDVGAARLVVPGDWRAAPVRSAGIAGLDPASTAVLEPYSGAPSRTIVTVAPIDDASLLPRPLRAAAAVPLPPARPTRLAGLRAWLYAGLRMASGDRTMNVTVLPTTAGAIAVACVSPIAWSPAGGQCASSVEAVGLRAAGTLTPSPDLALRLRLSPVVATLDAVRVRARAGLRHAATPATQARWARALARADRAAAVSLRPVAGAALLQALAGTARAYERLAAAATAGSAGAFSGARREIDRAEAGLAASLAGPTTTRPKPAASSRPVRPAPAAGSSAGPTRWPVVVALALLLVALLAGVGIRTLQGRASRSWWGV